MEYVFQNDFRIYFLMEFIKGGELFTHIIEKKRFDEESTKYVIAQIALAIGYVHSKDIIYRDLKPENVMIENDGYVKLIDFGLSRILPMDDIALTFWGTAEYCSPEMINEVGHNKNTDWWALGVILYEMLVGIPPFYDKERERMFMKIKSRSPKYPDKNIHGFSVSATAKDLITKLLDKDMTMRMGSKYDADEILAHPFFEGINMDDLMDKKVFDQLLIK
jgi:serum/glucocorticoid-regulated kinase 2